SKIVSGSYDQTVCIWDATTGTLVNTLKGHTSYVTSVAFSHDSSKIVSGSYDQTVCIWDATTGTLINTLKGHTSGVKSVAFAHHDSFIISHDFCGHCLCWRTDNFSECSGHLQQLSIEGEWIAMAPSSDKSPRKLCHLPMPSNQLGDIAYSGNQVAFGVHSGEVYILDFSA
ncbi:hypothetical protein FRC03_007280, partial [Tulasnella sp. 419]